MFFRRRAPRQPAFEERLQMLREAGCQIELQPDGRVKVSRNGSAAIIEDVPGSGRHIVRAGRILGDEIGLLIDGGFQKFWGTPSGRRAPALADQLQELHAFEEDLRKALGLVSRYHTSLGTTNDLHIYDAVRLLNH